MKKLLTAILVMLLLFTLVGCNEQAGSPVAPEEMPPPVEVVPDPYPPNEEDDASDNDEREDEIDADAPINIAELIGRDFDEHRYLFGNLINWGGGPTTTDFIFDIGISLTMKLDADRPPDWLRDFDIQLQLEEPGWIQILYVQFDEPEDEGVRSFAGEEGFLGYEHSRRFHFNGIGYQSMLADVEAAFSPDSFNRAYIKELNILGDYLLQPIGLPIPREGNVEIAVLDDDAFHWLIGRLESVIYWNDYFAITFQFSADGRVIDILVYSAIKE